MAGLACACELVDSGFDVVLLEARDRLGGRAYSFREKTTRALIDNCQHVILGCCDAAIGFLTKIGSIHLVEFSDTIDLVGVEGRRLRIRASSLPSPLHLLPSILAGGYLPAVEKMRAVRVMAGLAARGPRDGENARDYLRSLGCSDRLLDSLLEPVLVSALNERASEASAEAARFVLTQALLADRRSYRLGVPMAPLSELLAAPAATYLRRRGCQIRLRAKVKKLDLSGGSVTSAVLDSGEEVTADMWVSATRPDDLDSMGFALPASSLEMEWRPIVSAHLFFEGPHPSPPFDRARDRPRGGEGATCVVGEPFGWVFNKSGGYVQAVASAAWPITRATRSDLTYLALRAAAKAAPGIEKLRLASAVFVREMRATFSTACASRAARPPAVTSLANLFLAGDWTDTGWPATIESAVRSGLVAARAIAQVLGVGGLSEPDRHHAPILSLSKDAGRRRMRLPRPEMETAL